MRSIQPSPFLRSISHLLEMVENGEIGLPEIQRGFVWTMNKVRDLVDSIYRGYPVGSIILWEVSPDASIPSEFLVYLPQVKRSPRYLVVDGQQRLLSLLLVKNRRLMLRDGRHIELHLFFDPLNETFSRVRWLRYDPRWFDVTEVFNAESIYDLIEPRRERLQQLGYTNEDINKVYRNLEKLRNRLRETVIPAMELPSSMEYEDIANIFIRINRKGTRITTAELLLSLLTVKVPRILKSDVNEFMSELKNRGWELNIPVIMRAFVAIATKQGRLYRFESFAGKMSPDDIKRSWAATKRYLNHVIRILEENLKIRGSNILPSLNALVPFVVFMFMNEGCPTGRELSHMLLWFLVVSFWGGYTESRLDADVRRLYKNRSVKPLLEEVQRRFGRIKPDEEALKIWDEGTKLLMYVILRDAGALDWYHGYEITSDMDVHHVFPVTLLSEYGYTADFIHDPANMTFLSRDTNRWIIRNREPKEYLKEIIRDYGEDRLKGHLIPMDEELWSIDMYAEFLRKRRKMLLNAIDRYFKEKLFFERLSLEKT